MRLGDFSRIIETTFVDKMSITRYEDKENADGSTDTVLPDAPLHEEVPCRISFPFDESPKDSDVDNVPVKNVCKIFCKRDTDIRAGDFVTVQRFDDDGNVIATYSGKAGLSSVFITHKEALFSIERSA